MTNSCVLVLELCLLLAYEMCTPRARQKKKRRSEGYEKYDPHPLSVTVIIMTDMRSVAMGNHRT